MRCDTESRLILNSLYNPGPVWPDGYFDVLEDPGVH
jgi:hypothetical protein